MLYRGEIARGLVWPVEIVLNKPFGQAEMNEFADTDWRRSPVRNCSSQLIRHEMLQVSREAWLLLCGRPSGHLARLGRSAQGIMVAAAHTGDMLHQFLPGIDVILRCDGDLFHDG